ncbi:hypothetical protein E0Z10_g7402 [Xylaria hypoxylon]|uniref:F-box domain-containing protein n=1 Tax=Xylaria hypoxylon TaxID=37992 RepID=A0A4Z0YSC9_9PEZI|nr:hypothetical protein E0Z10_g7402 [Xylaria hypoxylon]
MAAADRLWSEYDRGLIILYAKSKRLAPSRSYKQGKEPTLEELAGICDKVDRFEVAVDTMSLTQWDTLKGVCETSDYEILFSELRAVDRADASWWRLHTRIHALAEEHGEILRHEIYYPNDLPPALVDQISRCLTSLMQSMHNFRSCVRNRINILARPSLRPLNVLDLPDELLMLVFDWTKGYYPQNEVDSCQCCRLWGDCGQQPTPDIQNARLTCRRFCNASSHLLIDYVLLEPQSDSLARLQGISRNPLIRKGVRAVEVSLRCYHSSLASNLGSFTTSWHNQFFSETMNTEHVRQQLDHRPGAREDRSGALLARANEIRKAWWAFGFNSNVTPGYEAYVEALQVCYDIYRKRYEDQRRLLTSGLFAQGAATALAQMPTAQTLTFGDRSCFNFLRRGSKPWYEVMDNPTKLAMNYLNPFGTWEAEVMGFSSELPMNLVVEILGALPKLGAAVKNLNIDISGAANMSQFVPELQVGRNLTILAQQLSSISVRIQRFVDRNRTSAPVQMAIDIYPFLSAILDTDSLEDIFLYFDQVGTDGPRSPSFGPLFTRRRRPNLKTLRLTQMSLYEHELQPMIDSLTPRRQAAEERVYVALNALNLLSGSWENTADTLRVQGNISLRIVYAGAEFSMETQTSGG